MSDLWKTPPPVPGEEPEEEPREQDPERYEARHRAEGRPPLIRRKAKRLRDLRDVEEPAWQREEDELLTQRPENEPRWTGEQSSAVWPQAPEVSQGRLDTPPPEPLPSRSELRRTRRTPEETAPRSPDYMGRHLAPKKRTLFARPSVRAQEDEETFVAREEIATEPEEEPPAAALPAEPLAETEEATELEAEEAEVEEATEEVAADDAAPEIAAPETPVEVTSEIDAAADEDVMAAAATEPDEVIVLDEPDPVVEEAPAVVRPEAPPPPPAALVEESLAFDDGVSDVDVSPQVDDRDDEDVLGPRRQKLLRRRRRTRIAQIVGSVLLSLALVVGAVIVGGKVIEEAGDEKVADTAGGPPAVREPVTTLIFGTRGEGTRKEALWMTLLTYDPEDEQGAVVYIPSHTAVEVPGRGLQGVGESYATGGVELLLVSAENLLGIPIDRYIELNDGAARDLFDATGPLPVNVPTELRVAVGDDEARLILVEGPQEVSPSLLVKMLYLRGIDGDDVELGSRHLAFWDALLEHLNDEDAMTALVEDAAPAFGESDASTEDHRRFLSTLASLPTSDLTITTLPVRPISAGESELYAADEAEVREFLTSTIGFAPPAREDVRVQVLNGNGVPGIGQDVARKLVGEGFRVILSGNARRLTYRRTLIITYDNSVEGQRLAERAKRLLGVGEVQVSAQQQGIVDLTIVVGKDFLRAD